MVAKRPGAAEGLPRLINEGGNIDRLAAENSVVSCRHDAMVPSVEINSLSGNAERSGRPARSFNRTLEKKGEELAC